MSLNAESTTPTLHAPVSDACGVPEQSRKSGDRPYEETTIEQTPDGGFRRQRNAFTRHFGDGPDEAPVEAGRYHILGALGCGWNRRQRIVIRLLGLEDVFVPEVVYGRDDDGWKLTHTEGGVAELFGYERLNDFYRNTSDEFSGRGTSPTVIDLRTGKVVTNNYHVISNELESAWKPLHKQGAPDLYPTALREEIDLLNQQIFDDINNGTYKVIFATSKGAAQAAYTVFKARLADYDFRLASRRYLFGNQLTDSDVRLFQTLESFENGYRPGIIKQLGTDDILHIWDFPNIWGYARDLFQTPGFIDDAELYALGYVPNEQGEYSQGFAKKDNPFGQADLQHREEQYASWLENPNRGTLEGSPLYSGPGGGGSFELWGFNE
ncbi:MAG: hypothetical protein LKF41_05930 [Bifidobacterium sp.]|jgi:putative glutathione S-transferase|nr:hypothetical protein [Bifidobacterium sp.]MCH4175383.1 hypothetical protein [Bifidobacterium sp.]